MSEDKIDAGRIETDQITIGGAGLRIGELAEFESDSRPTPGQSLVFIVAMLGIGALVHGWLLGPTFDVHNVWSWGYIIAWPIVLLGMALSWIGYLLLGLGVIALVAYVAFWLRGWLGDGATARKRRRDMDELGARQQEREAVRRGIAAAARQEAENEAFQQGIDPADREEWVASRTRAIFNAAIAASGAK